MYNSRCRVDRGLVNRLRPGDEVCRTKCPPQLVSRHGETLPPASNSDGAVPGTRDVSYAVVGVSREHTSFVDLGNGKEPVMQSAIVYAC